MIEIVIWHDTASGAFKFRHPESRYINSPSSVTYWGYSLSEAKRKYRQDFNLRYKHIEFIVI